MPKKRRNAPKFTDDHVTNGPPPTTQRRVSVCLTVVDGQEQLTKTIDSYRAGFEELAVRPGPQLRNVNPVFASSEFVSRDEYARWSQRETNAQEQTTSLVLSTSTLLPIDTGRSNTHVDYSNYVGSLEVPPLQICSNVHAKQIGVFGWGPSSGPAGCKLFIFLRHTSLLAVKLLSLLHTHDDVETRFWIDFDGTKVPAAPHKYYFRENEYPLEDVNAEGLGRDREVLLALVPASVRRRVPVWLYVIGERGRHEHNVQLGYFDYDENVPLRTYKEATCKGPTLMKFLESERPSSEDVRDLSQYLNSEISNEPSPRNPEYETHTNEIDLSQHHLPFETQSPLKERPKRTLHPKTSPDALSQTSYTLSPPDPDTNYSLRHSCPPSSTSFQTRRHPGPNRRSRTTKSSSIPKPSSPQKLVRQQYVTIKFTDPKPSTLGLPTYESWSTAEKARNRRLIAFTCRTDKPKFQAHFTAVAIPHLDVASNDAKVVSCIYVPAQASQMPHSCIITSYDFINLISWMLRKPSWFTVHERNRVRRNLEIFNPQTLHKEGAYDVWDLFKQVTTYQNPKPWNIQKDFKVFDWNVVEDMMKEILKKYTVVVGEDEALRLGQEGLAVGEGDDIEDELVKANRDLLEEFARMQEKRGEDVRKLVRYNSEYSSGSIFPPSWKVGGERLPGHACSVEESGVETQQNMMERGQWHSFEEGEEMGLEHTQSQTIFDQSQAWTLSQSQASHFDGYIMNPGHFAGEFLPNLELSQGQFEGINPALQNYYDQGQFVNQGWPVHLEAPHLGMQNTGRSGILHQLNLEEEEEKHTSAGPEEEAPKLEDSDEEKLSMADMIVGSPPEHSTAD